jgi:DNA-binding SARP family transcriptional activator/tetratricopeptide (TPR) repeat protein
LPLALPTVLPLVRWTGDAVQFRVLGRVEADHHGVPVPLGRRRERCLLGVLLLDAGRPVSGERLAALLWDDAPPATAHAALNTHMSRLRNRLDPQHNGSLGVRLVNRHGGYLAEADPQTVDAHRFRALCDRARTLTEPGARSMCLREALALWRGPVLADVASPRLRERVGVEVTELQMSATVLAIDAELACGRHQQLVGELSALTAEHPYHERLTGQLMLALYRCDRYAEALAAYRRLGDRLAGDLGVNSGPALRDLHTAILRRDPELTGPVFVGDGPGLPVPAQLPADVSHFTGRENQVKSLAELLAGHRHQPGPVVISAITGIPGVGKTALAVHFAHQVADRFPDGQLYVNLRGYESTEPMSPDDVLAGFLRALGVKVSTIPQSLDERASLYRSVLAGRRVFVLLDNARTAEQVRPLLPGTPTSMVAVTSRDDLAGLVARDGAQRLTLDSLPEADAIRLLSNMLGAERVAREPTAAADLAHLCGCLPLALRVVGERAVRRVYASLADLATELADQAHRLDLLDTPSDAPSAVRAVFSWSYQALPDTTARLFRRLGLHDGVDFDARAATLLHGTGADVVPDRRVIAALDTLVAAHLLESPSAGRYHFHDLIRLYATERASAEETRQDRDEALRRLLSWYLRMAAAAGLIINPHRRHISLDGDKPSAEHPPFDTYDQALGWLESERANLVAAVGQAARQELHEIAWKLPIALWDLFHLGRHWSDWITTHEIALSSARSLGNREAESWILNRLANAYRGSNQPQKSIDCLHRSLAISQQTENRREQASALGNLGNAYHMLKRFNAAMEHFRQALALYRDIGDPYGESSALTNLGWVHTSQEEPAEAVGYYSRALAISRQISNKYIESTCLSNLAQAYLRLGHLDQAITHGTEALAVAQDSGNRTEHAQTLNTLGHAAQQQGRLDDARQAWQEAYSIFQELGDPQAPAVHAALASLDTRPTPAW